MKIPTKSKTDLTVRAFAYVAKQLARSPSMPYEQILSEAEKHRSALRLTQRDVFDMAEQGLRMQTLTKAEFNRLCDTAVQATAQAEQEITRIVARYAPHMLAA